MYTQQIRGRVIIKSSVNVELNNLLGRTYPTSEPLELLEVADRLTFFWSMHRPVYKIKEFVKLRIKNINAGMLKLVLSKTEIYQQYKLTPCVQSMGIVRLLFICQYVKFLKIICGTGGPVGKTPLTGTCPVERLWEALVCLLMAFNYNSTC